MLDGMQRPLRSLSGLLDFDAAARWGSFRLAALELNKTPAAVSQQVKQLEQTLGFALFVRHPRHIALTAKGHELAASVARLLQDLRAKVGALQAGEDESVLRVSTTHSFAMKWLVPRLHRYTRQHPDIDLRVESNDKAVLLEEGVCDVALRYGRIAGGTVDDIVHRERMIVVYGSELAAKQGHAKPPKSLAALLRYPLLYEDTPEPWLRLIERDALPRRRYDFSRSYSHAGLLVQAAVAGLGVALVPCSLAFEDLAAGRLILAPCEPMESAWCYRVLTRPTPHALPKIRQFADWVRVETADMMRDYAGFSREWQAAAPRTATL